MVLIGDLNYTLDDGSFTAVLNNGNQSYSGPSNCVIPSTVDYNGNTYTVVSLNPQAFAGNATLTSIVIPDSVQSIRYSCFSPCSNLSSVTLPSGLTVIETYCFKSCDIRSIVIPSSVTAIQNYAFDGNMLLRSVYFSQPTTLPIFGFSAFGLNGEPIPISVGYHLQSISQSDAYNALVASNLFTSTAVWGPPLVCFKEASKILTDKGYQLIEDLRKGDLVKTVNHGFVPINMIGKREMWNYALKEERIKDQLYQCSKENFEEIFEPLIITGCHSILVDEFSSSEQREKVKEVNGDTYITDDKYRLPACVDERTTVYEKEGLHTIYHLALDHDDYYMNYGIYANGLLVETCSKRYLKELSGMTLIE
jgi:hypothetical protein